MRGKEMATAGCDESLFLMPVTDVDFHMTSATSHIVNQIDISVWQVGGRGAAAALALFARLFTHHLLPPLEPSLQQNKVKTAPEGSDLLLAGIK